MLQPKVLIAGAGLGGLCLAQGPKRAGIDFHVYERDQAPDYRLQGYRIRIHSHGVSALRQCLLADVYELFEKTCAEMTGMGNLIDPSTGKPKVQTGGPMLGPGRRPPPFSDPRTVDRRVLRDVLLVGLEDRVSFGKAVDHFSTNNTDSVTVFFGDGTSSTGTLLVGADGAQSRVRKLFLPNHKPLDTGGRIFYGKTPLTAGLDETFMAVASRGMSRVRDSHSPIPSTTLLEPIVFPPACSRPAHPQLPEDYVYWVVCSQSTDLSSILNSELIKGKITPDEAVKATKQITQHWHPNLRQIFETQDACMSSMILVSTHAPEMPVWQSVPTVTLIGDAMHVMPPTGASGCVTALRDAALLVEKILSKGMTDGVADESEMRGYAGDMIQQSLGAAVQAFGFKPREEWPQVEG